MSASAGERQFNCQHCQGEISVPADLPPTTAPCPMCGQSVTSPGPVVEQVVSSVPVSQEPVSREPEVSAGAAQVGADAEKGGMGIWPWVAGLLGLAVLVGLFVMFKKLSAPPVANGPVAGGQAGGSADGATASRNKSSVGTAKMGEDAEAVLDGFLSAATPEEKAKFIIGGESRVEDLRAFYGSPNYVAGDLKASDFAAVSMTEFDLERGLYLMEYDRPEQFGLGQFFRPIATMEVERRVEAPGIHIWPGALRSNFEVGAERARVFFKKVEGGYKIDWDTFVQTNYRTFREFTASPEAGKSGEFRVLIAEDVTTNLDESGQTRVYRMADVAHLLDDQAASRIRKDSTAGMVLEQIAWTDREDPNLRSVLATVKLSWSNEEKPRLLIDEVICWELLGIGGERGNTNEVPK